MCIPNLNRLSYWTSFTLLLFTTQLAWSQTPHLVGWHSKQAFQASFEDCFQQSIEAAQKVELKNIQTHDGWVVSGYTRYLRVAISCIQVSEGVMINIQVAGEANHEPETIAMRDSLKSHILSGRFPQAQTSSANQQPGSYSEASVRTEKAVYRPAEPIVVEFSNLKGERSDEWLTIVPSGAEPGSFRQWKYTGKQKNGSMQFMGLAQGQYEIRYHYANGDKVVRARHPFRVGM